MTRFPPVIHDDLPQIVEALGERMSALAGRSLLVTGASGMLPAYLVDAVAYANASRRLSSPCRLILLSRSAERLRERFAHLLDEPEVEVLIGDARAELPSHVRPDFIVHAAAPASPKDYLADPVGSLDANTAALRTLLEVARRGALGVLYVSSSEVYGTPEPDCIPTPETYVGRIDPLSRRAYYAEAKRAGETYCRAYFEQFGVPVAIARPFHVHGPGLRADDGRIVPALISMGLRGERLRLESDGRATRTYGYVSDTAVAMLSILLGEARGEAFNVGTDTPETSVLELATQIARLLGQAEPVTTNTAPQSPHAAGAPARACPDLSKLRRSFYFEPRVGLTEGLRRTVSWFRYRAEASR